MMDKSKAAILRQRLITTLGASPLGSEFEVDILGGRFNTREVTFRVRIAEKPVAGGKSREQEEFEAYARLFGLKPEDWGRTFEVGDVAYKIVGLRLKARKAPIIVERADNGKLYAMMAEGVVMRMLEVRP